MMSIFGGILAALLALGALFGCGALTAFQDVSPQPQFEPAQPFDPSVSEPTFRSEVSILDVEVLVMESDPPQLALEVTGYTDGCDYPVITEVSQDGNTFYVEIYRDVPVAASCPAVAVDYTASVALGLVEPGTYTIWVNGYFVEQTI